jgi:hypothetical protein
VGRAGGVAREARRISLGSRSLTCSSSRCRLRSSSKTALGFGLAIEFSELDHLRPEIAAFCLQGLQLLGEIRLALFGFAKLRARERHHVADLG